MFHLPNNNPQMTEQFKRSATGATGRSFGFSAAQTAQFTEEPFYEQEQAQQALSPVTMAIETVTDMFTAANKTEMTRLEGILWAREIARLGTSALMSFAELWMGGRGQGSFRRAPTIDDFLTHADPHYANAETGLECLVTQVKLCGAYNTPEIKNPMLIEAVQILGGWEKVCRDLPDPSLNFEYKQYAEKFKAAWTQSEAKAVQKKLSPQPLLGLSEISKRKQAQLKLKTSMQSSQPTLVGDDSTSISPPPSPN